MIVAIIKIKYCGICYKRCTVILPTDTINFSMCLRMRVQNEGGNKTMVGSILISSHFHAHMHIALPTILVWINKGEEGTQLQ